jgi:hypothetical protein
MRRDGSNLAAEHKPQGQVEGFIDFALSERALSATPRPYETIF